MAAQVNNQQTLAFLTGLTPVGSLAGQNVSSEVVLSKVFTLTLAQINAGAFVLGDSSGLWPSHKISVRSFKAKVTGTFTTLTAVVLQTTESSPVAVFTLGVAGLTNGALLSEFSASDVTLGAGFLVDNAEGYGFKVVKTGSTGAGGTSITFYLDYVVRPGA